MAGLEEASVDAIVTDPPYGLEFMGKEWDRLQTGRSRWKGQDNESLLKHTDFKDLGTLPSFAAQSRNPRCENCGKFRWDHVGRKCECDRPTFKHAHMGYEQQAWHQAWAEQAFRVLKPGGHLLAFGGTRTAHRLVCAIEDAGFEIRDTICWLYGSGFPKSLDVSKAIDKQAGAEREVVGQRPDADKLSFGGKHEGWERPWMADEEALERCRSVTAPATDDARRWQGWGTALKPAHEPIVVARKPLVGTVAGNVLEFGTGALNVAGCRVATDDDLNGGAYAKDGKPRHDGAESWRYKREGAAGEYVQPAGRWPANVVLDEEAAGFLDAQTGERGGGFGIRGSRSSSENWRYPGEGEVVGYGDSGGASRFFYVAKASRAERNAGLDGFEEQETRGNYGDGIQDARPHTREGYEYRAKTRNTHPTVKPVALMRWLVRLVTPPDGLVLDPFAGSGTTGIAAHLEGLRFLGIERDEEYAAIAEARIRWWVEHGEEALRIVAGRERAEAMRAEVAAAGQLDLGVGV